MLSVIAVAQIILAWVALILGLTFGIWLLRQGRRTRMRKLTFWGYVLCFGGAVLGAGLFWPAVAYLYTEHLWYDNLGLASVFWRILGTQWKLFFWFASAAAGFMLLNLFIADRLCPVSREFQRWTRQKTQAVRRLAMVLIVLISCGIAAPMMRLWNEYLLYRHQVPFGHNRLSQVSHTGMSPQEVPIRAPDLDLIRQTPLRAIVSDGPQTLYVAGDEAILVLRDENGTWAPEVLTTEIHHPKALLLAPDGQLYITSEDKVYRLDPQTRSLQTWVKGLNSPRGMAIDAEGNFYVAEYGRNRITRLIDANGDGKIEGEMEKVALLSNEIMPHREEATKLIEQRTFLFRIDSKFEGDLANGTLSEGLRDLFEQHGITLPSNTNLIEEKRNEAWSLTEEDSQHQRYAIRKQGNVLVAMISDKQRQQWLLRLEAGEPDVLDDMATAGIAPFTQAERELLEGVSEHLSGPFALAFHDEGPNGPFLYIAEWSSGEVSRYNLQTHSLFLIADGLSSPRDLTFDDQGMLYVVETGSHEVSAIPQIRVARRVAHGFSNPMGITFAPDGSLYVAESVATDPIFNREIGFYVFSLPIWHWVSLWAKALLWITLIGGAFIYNFYYNRDPQSMARVERRVIKHASLLWILLLMVSLWRSQINMWQLLNRKFPMSHVYGVGYTQAYGQIPGYRIYMALVTAIAVLVFLNMFWRKKTIWYTAIATWTLSYPILVWLFPFLVLRLRVRPNEQRLERPYIQHNINGTRRGFALDQITESHLIKEQAKLATIESHPETLRNLQLWDRRVLYQHLVQTQSLRAYYYFNKYNDVDRYLIDGQHRQVLLAAREINYDAIEPRTWVNERLKFTHGYGVCVAPVNEFTPQGDPILWVRDIPPVSAYPDGRSIPELEIHRPEIYYGELMGGLTGRRRNDYALVNTDEAEVDYTITLEGTEKKQLVHYAGQGGIPLGPGWSFRRLAFVWRFGRLNFLLTRALKPSSRIMFRRQVLRRAQTVAPFLEYDSDPYIVIGNDGQLWWVIDLYVKSKEYPYSEPFIPPFTPKDQTLNLEAFRGTNYIRNPGVVIINAYDGRVQYYFEENDEPMSEAYRRAFPELFRNMEEIPSGLEYHIRYPDTLTLIQASRYTRYHMKDPDLFYPNDDLWYLPEEVNGNRPDDWVPMVPYYTVLTLPGETQPEFVNMIPFRPPGARDAAKRMTAWMVARCDPPHYGELMVYALPRNQVVDSPEQVESRIGQDAEISKAFTLWGSVGGGSDVIRGNLLVIPVENSLFYVEPVYIQATGAPVPQLKQVVVVAEDNLAMGASFDEALRRVFIGAPVGEGIAEAGSPPAGTPKPTREMLVELADSSFQRYYQLMGEGKIVEAAEELARAKQAIEALRRGDYTESP